VTRKTSLGVLIDIVNFFLYFLGWFQLRRQPWFVPFSQSDEDHLGCYENYTMFAISSFQYIILAFVFSKGAPYRKPIWSNWPLCLTMLINICIVVYLVVYPSKWISDFLQLVVPQDMSFRFIMLLYGLAAFITHALLEAFVVDYVIFKRFQVRREQNMNTSARKYMRLQYNINSFDNWPPISDAFELSDSTDPPAEIQPTYVNLSAEQNVDAQHVDFPGFFDNFGNSVEARPNRELLKLQI